MAYPCHWALIRSWLPLFPVGESVQRYLTGGEHRRKLFSLGNKKLRLVSNRSESTRVTGVFEVRPVLEGSGRDADPYQRQLLGPSVLANRRRAAPPARLPHRLPSLNRVVPQQPPPSHRLRRAGRKVAVGPNRYPLRVKRRRVGLEVTELLLLLGIQPPFTTSLLWRLVKAAVLVGHA